MRDLARDAEASMRALGVHVQVLQDRLELARTPASDVDTDDVAPELLLHVTCAAEVLEQAIGRVLDRIDPGGGCDARALAGLLRRHMPHDPAARRTATTATGEDAATI